MTADQQNNARSSADKWSYTNGQTNSANGHAVELELDAVVIGGGFSGVYLLHKLRQEGFNVKLVEAGSALGGIWHWNNYPGARVDSPYPVYALDVPEVYETWEWTELYPGAAELQRYFRHVDKVLDISKDTLFDTRVDAATWDDVECKWHIKCNNGTKITAHIMNLCLGFAAKRHFPDWPGLESFKGYMCHSSYWPLEGIDMRGKKVAVIGNGATGIQIAQTSAREAAQLEVFIRTANHCLPMRQSELTKEIIDADRHLLFEQLREARYKNIGGFLFPTYEKKVFDDPPEEREKHLQQEWDRGGFRLIFAYSDILIDEKANREVYDFWVRKVRERVTDPAKQDILAPLEPAHSIFGKRPSLEQDYYEQMDKPHVKLVDLKKVDVTKVVPEGIVTSDGVTHEFDIIAIATGFDSLTGSFMQIDIRGINGESLKEKWSGEQGALSYLGIAVHNFPNLFYTYGPHSPTAYGNGPSIVQPQDNWIVDVMKHMREKGLKKINAQEPAEKAWKQLVNEIHAMTLRDKVDSWYMGSNIPGKPRQALNWGGGLPMYFEALQASAAAGYQGFDLS